MNYLYPRPSCSDSRRDPDQAGLASPAQYDFEEPNDERTSTNAAQQWY